MQELSEATFDLLGFGLWSGEPEQDVIGIPDVTQPPILGIQWIRGREVALLLLQRPRSGMVAAFASTPDGACDPLVLRIGSPVHTSGVFRQQSCLDELVQPVQVDVGQDR